MSHAGHHIKKCKECGTVVSQCRCMDASKPIIEVVCPACETIAESKEKKTRKAE